MPIALRVALLALLAAGCAPARPTSAPGSSADRTPHGVETLAFEAPSGFSTRSVPFIDAQLAPPQQVIHGGREGLTVSFCADGTPESCGALGVRSSTELGARRCADRQQVRLWLRLQDGDDLYAARYADRDGWLVGGTSGEGYHRLLILCDGKKLWYVKAIATGAAGVSPAKLAFELFLKTVRIDSPPPAGGTWIQGT
jgi:hypothetical protein